MRRIIAFFLILTMLFCTACQGKEAEGTVVICGNCAARVSESSQYCSSCGVQLFANNVNATSSAPLTPNTSESQNHNLTLNPPTTTTPVTTPPVTNPPATSPPATTATHTHSYTPTVIVKPTCTEQGYTTYSCSCGHTYTADVVKPTNHSYTKKITAATCTASGYTTYTCICGDYYISDFISSGHSYSNYACSLCGAADKSHAYEYLIEWVKANGTQNNDNIEYIFKGKDNPSNCYGLTYSTDNDYLYIWHYDATTGVSAYNSIFLDVYYYGFTFGDDRIYGYITPSTYTQNTSLTYSSSHCSVLTPEKLLPAAKSGVDVILATFRLFLYENNFGISIADLGFTAF